MRRIVSRNTGWKRLCKPESTERFFVFASSQAAFTILIPAGSMACGFSTNTCLPASMAAFMCSGWNLAALAISTTSERSITFL